ncbi:sigma-54 interaction domain-containing protein [Leadbettera azotonutricia]|uniref:Hydrogenase-4 transcriptional activator n=1 Tax=Leadbettera azotonutricia (strain ATCC BAA-888 / DSM 13862 / ZAS-9) TaxID=545695 RepID=F5Y9Q7_LEAAZ|nr:sigma 54-interacting transcriptional regulator [Leadbettera azotonutricia]AEF82520.1 hydrogenase-4 transcriptional activator [Leadbettera azotonutricia ZAS-9]
MYQRSRDGLRLLFEISSLLSESDHIEAILKPVLDQIASCLGIRRGMITILNRETREIAIAEAWGLDEHQKLKGRYSLGEGITGQVIETGNPAVIKRIADDPRFLNRTGARKNAEAMDTSFVCIPIKLGLEVIGAIGIDLNYSSESLDYEVGVLTVAAASISQVVRLQQVQTEEMADLQEENSRLYEELRVRYNRPKAIIGNSKIMRLLYSQMEQVSATNATVLLLGESGVGKERVAHTIHYASPRSLKPFIKLNCAAIPESLIEDTLFGHEKGAFTGAVSLRKGYFEEADCGTIFLDEIGEMPLQVQTKFLRVLQEREFERIGGTRTIKVNIRVIAATNRDLPALIREGIFREDLYYRLSVFPLVIPPLRERKTDIMLLANHFLERISAEHGKEIRSISPAAVSLMTAYSWPGNVRELENCIERAVILSTDGTIHSYHLPPNLQKKQEAQGGRKRPLKEVLESVEKELITEEYRWTRGSIARAAANLGISERIMGLRAAKYGLKKENYTGE